jgi:hypothetical protein
MKTAQQVAEKMVRNAGAASGEYVSGAEQTTKDQSSAAIAAKGNYQAALTASFARGAFEKGLAKSGKAGWLAGVRAKGQDRFATGVAAGGSKYAANSAKYDSARGAAASLPRGVKGSPTNIARVTAVVNALRTTKNGSAA